eukprot:TRINITY_DN2927_c3_g1_i1.p1 TRINITY_DN2927_c3_g1~~TRINITY_DN2927_c3_g1_i1.p1  ORF type:complete len:412 (+),score=77.55 TRINITY_DN2927_c3_g1_i1:174-1238(+)
MASPQAMASRPFRDGGVPPLPGMAFACASRAREEPRAMPGVAGLHADVRMLGAPRAEPLLRPARPSVAAFTSPAEPAAAWRSDGNSCQSACFQGGSAASDGGRWERGGRGRGASAEVGEAADVAVTAAEDDSAAAAAAVAAVSRLVSADTSLLQVLSRLPPAGSGRSSARSGLRSDPGASTKRAEVMSSAVRNGLAREREREPCAGSLSAPMPLQSPEPLLRREETGCGLQATVASIPAEMVVGASYASAAPRSPRSPRSPRQCAVPATAPAAALPFRVINGREDALVAERRSPASKASGKAAEVAKLHGRCRYEDMSVSDLKLELRQRGLDSLFCFSREDLVERLREHDKGIL